MDPTVNSSAFISSAEVSFEQKQPLEPQLEKLVTLSDGLKTHILPQAIENNTNLSEKKVVELKAEKISDEEKETISISGFRNPPETITEPPSSSAISPQQVPANLERAQARHQEENSTAVATGVYFGGGGVSLALIVFGAIMNKFNQDENHTYTQAIEYTSIAFIVFGCFMCCCGGASAGVAYAAQQRRRQG